VVEYRHNAPAVTDLKYPVIWVTKYRYKILRGDIAERARDLIRQICVAREVTIASSGPESPPVLRILPEFWRHFGDGQRPNRAPCGSS
jgi:putative transposase